MRRRAISFFSNGLGNLVMMMPALQALASMTESGKIDVCLDQNWKDSRRQPVEDILRAWPVVDRIFSWPETKFDSGEYDLWFFTAHGNTASPVVSMFLRYTALVARPRTWRLGDHEVDHYMDVARAQGYQGPFPEVKFPVAEGPMLDLQRPIIGICNGWFRGGNGYWSKKGWPHFAELSEVVKGYFGGSVVSVGAENEMPKDVVVDRDFTGKLTILESAKVISQLNLFVTTDTGPMHIANALNIPLIALFGPTLTSKNAPRGVNSVALVGGVNCAPCQDTPGFHTCEKFECMESIAVDDVMTVAREILGGDEG